MHHSLCTFHKPFSAAKHPFISSLNSPPFPPSPPSSSTMEADAASAKPKPKHPRPRRAAAKRTQFSSSPPPPGKGSDTVGDIEDFSVEEALGIRASLLRWYDEHQRVLPWRTASARKDGAAGGGGEEERAYAVWVSEVMLQQTRVQTVVGYYNRWMDRWPTIQHLAAASQEEVNEMWAGLGYYRRARFLLEGAQSIVREGEFPRTAADLRKVRGIGDYTAGAIASIAFNEPVPVVDGNVIRVISRLKAISASPKESATVKHIWKLAAELVDPSRPGDFNQAMMELGATLCSVTSPSCSTCPVSDQCLALQLSNKSKSIKVTDYPTKVAKIKQRNDFAAICVVQLTEELDEMSKVSDSKDVFLLVKRPEEGLLAGLWEFPSVLLEGGTDVSTRKKAINRYLKDLLNLDLRKNCHVILREDIGKHVHVFSHIRLHMHVELLILNLKGGLNQLCNDQNQSKSIWKFVDGNSLKNIGLTSGVRKVYGMVQDFKEKLPLLNPAPAPLKKCKRSVK